ncbi:MAG TPA: winged helix-turn-helix domain-containing protein [Steroidobacteraceae bacterium]|nr:winged helix-turn-helix domain-containing protein [Steroidobacteraceae bacterium]
MHDDRGEGLRIGEWRVTRQSGELERNGEIGRLEPKVMDLLVLLAEHEGAVVSHQRIRERLWPRVIVSEDTLARTVSKLRKALGDTSRPARYVGTVPKRGYRLLAPVLTGEPRDDGARSALPRLSLWRRCISGMTLAALVAVGVGILATLRASAPEASTPRALAEHAEDFYFRYSFADNQAAIALYERIIALRPDYAPAYAGLANALAQTAIRWPAAPDPRAATYTQLGDALRAGHLHSDRARRLLARAEELARLAIELAPDDATSHKALGLVRSAQSDFDGALVAYRRALALDADAWGVLINIGDVLEIAGDDAQALQYFESALVTMTRLDGAHAARARPWLASLGVAIGDRHLARADLQAAEHAYRQVLERSPLDETATRKLAQTLARRGELEAARSVCAEFGRRMGSGTDSCGAGI